MATIMRDAAISFPMLGSWSIDPPASFTLFGHTFYWYGAIIALGFLLAILFCAKTAPRLGISGDDIYDLALWALPIGIIGARIYFVIFQWQDYKDNFWDVFKIWEGGLAIYGGVIAGALTAIFWSRAKKIPLGATLDIGSFGLIIGQTVGRWGNFMNREAFGAETDIFCRMGLTLPGQETIYVHPTFLYESLWNLVGFILMDVWLRRGKRRYDGQIFILYVLWYGVGRALVEGLRTDSLYITGTDIRVSQLLAALSAVTAAVLLIVNARRSHPQTLADRVRAEREAAAQETENPADDVR